MEFSASNNFTRTSPQKMRLVLDLVRGKSALIAQQQLMFMPHRAAKFLLTLLNSAIANAENNFGADRANLVIAKLTADAGPVITRYQPRAMGRVYPLKSRTSKVKIVLAEIDTTQKRKEVAKAEAPKAVQLSAAVAADASKPKEEGTAKATDAKPATASKAPRKGFGQRIFNRKGES